MTYNLKATQTISRWEIIEADTNNQLLKHWVTIITISLVCEEYLRICARMHKCRNLCHCIFNMSVFNCATEREVLLHTLTVISSYIERTASTFWWWVCNLNFTWVKPNKNVNVKTFSKAYFTVHSTTSKMQKTETLNVIKQKHFLTEQFGSWWNQSMEVFNGNIFMPFLPYHQNVG